MAYREPAEIPQEVVLTARRAIMDLHHEFHGTWNVDPESLKECLEKAHAPEGDASPHHIVRILRMFMRHGYRPEALMQAIVDLEGDGAFERAAKSRERNPYTEELVKSCWGYPSNYEPPSLHEQLASLGRYYPRLRTPKRVRTLPRVDGFSHVAIPKLSAVAKAWRIEEPFDRGYEAVLQRLSDAVQSVYRGYRFGFAKTPLDLKAFTRLRPHGSVRDALERMESRQPESDFLVLNGQWGIRWRGSSMRRIRWHCEHADFAPAPGYREFVLPAFAILNHLLILPQRLMSTAGLAMHSAGDDAVKGGFFGQNGIGFAFGHGVLHLLDCSQSSTDPMFGVPTGLVFA